VGDEKEKGSSTFRGLYVGHFVHLRTPLSQSVAPRDPLAASVRPARRYLSSSSFFLRCLRETKRKGMVILMRIRLVYAAISYLRCRVDTAVARLMNALCKYYFCLCTCQLSATLVLINNAKQSAGVTRSWRRSLPARLDAVASIPIR